MGGWRLVLSLAAANFAVTPLTSIAAAPAAHAQGVVVRDIQVVGNRRVEPETVRSYLQFNVGDV